MPKLIIRAAAPEDIPLIHDLIGEMARYEKLERQFVGTRESLARSLFERRAAHALVAEADGAAVGYAIYFYNFSTFECKPGLYLEDLFILPEHRRNGYGEAILRHLAGVAADEGCARMEWMVLNWNQNAINFYEKLGARPVEGWTVYRLDGDRLTNAARS